MVRRTRTFAACDYWFNNQVAWFQPWRSYIQNLQEWAPPSQVPIKTHVGLDTDQICSPMLLRVINISLGGILKVHMSGLSASSIWGPKIQFLVKDYKTLPCCIHLPRIDGEGEVSHQTMEN